LGELGVGGRIILRCILEEWDVIMWNGFICSGGGSTLRHELDRTGSRGYHGLSIHCIGNAGGNHRLGTHCCGRFVCQIVYACTCASTYMSV
jgi:hypothetical protein